MKKSSKKSEKSVKVNLGCGTHIIPGWVNIDNYIGTDAPDFLQGDAKNIPLDSNSVDYLLCDQVLEHIDYADVPTVMFQIRRVLKPGGKAVIIVPDFEDAVKQWVNQNFNETYNPVTYHWFSEVIYGNQQHPGEYHRTPMCARYLYEICRMVGFGQPVISFHPAGGAIPVVEGCRPSPQGSILRNAQLVCEVVK